MVIQISPLPESTLRVYKMNKTTEMVMLNDTENAALSGMATIAALVWMVFEFLVYAITIANSFLIIGYLKSKPLGYQTVLDKAYIQMFTSAILHALIRLPQAALHQMEIPLNEEIAWVYTWTINLFVNFLLMTYIGTIVLNAILVFFPTLLEDANEKVLLATFGCLNAVLAIAMCLASYMMGEEPPVYSKMVLEDPPEQHELLRVIILAASVIILITFRISLICTKKTVREGENGLISTTVAITILGMVFVLGGMMALGVPTNVITMCQIALLLVGSLIFPITKAELRRYSCRIIRGYFSLFCNTCSDCVLALVKHVVDPLIVAIRPRRVNPFIELQAL